MSEINNDMAQALTSNYMLVDTTIRRFGGFKKDKQASEDVTRNAGATSNSAKVTKDLLAGARAELSNVTTKQAAVRDYLKRMTLPWSSNGEGRSNTGARLLAVAKSIEFLSGYKHLHTDYAVALSEFLAVYDVRRAQAMQNLNALADPSDYPSRDEVEQLFSVDLEMIPVPAPSDFSRLAVPAALSESLGGIIAKKQTKAMENAMSDLNERIVAELKRMAVVLGKHGAGEKTRIYGSLVSNLSGLVGLLKSSNFSNNERLDELADKLGECTAYDIATIKANPTIAADIAQKAVMLTDEIENEVFF